MRAGFIRTGFIRTGFMKTGKKGMILLAAVVAAGTLGGCSQQAETSSQSTEISSQAEAAKETGKSDTDQGAVQKRKIIAATSGSPNPFIYTDENNELTGYEPAVLREVFSRLPQYELEFQLTEFASIFTGLDADLYQIGVNCLGYNTKRGEKYIYSDPMTVAPHGILVKEDNEDIKTVYDFAGRKTICTPTNANANSYERYNEMHPDDPIIIQYVDVLSGYDSQVADGRIDFYYHTKVNLESQLEATGVTGLKILDVPFEDSSTLTTGLEGDFVVFAKGQEELADDFNKAFEEALADGTIAKLQEQILGISPEQNVLDQEYIETARAFIENDLKENGGN